MRFVEPRRALGSVGEVAGARQEERDPGRLARRDRLVVADRASRLHDRPHARLDQHARTVGEREERIRGRDRPARSLGARPRLSI